MWQIQPSYAFLSVFIYEVLNNSFPTGKTSVFDSTPVMILSVPLLIIYQTIYFLQETQVCDGLNTSNAS